MASSLSVQRLTDDASRARVAGPRWLTAALSPTGTRQPGPP